MDKLEFEFLVHETVAMVLEKGWNSDEKAEPIFDLAFLPLLSMTGCAAKNSPWRGVIFKDFLNWDDRTPDFLIAKHKVCRWS